MTTRTLTQTSWSRRLAAGSVLLVLLSRIATAGPVPAIEAIRAGLEQNAGNHPRLLLTDTQMQAVRDRLPTQPALQNIANAVQRRAEAILSEAPVKRVLQGRRLLSQSRRCLERILHLGTAWRLTGNPKFRDRAENELLAAAAFEDWNPSHFLDVAEMTLALAVGYDWFFAELSPDVRESVRHAILEKGIQPSLEEFGGHNGWLRVENNWNQVCNAGMVYGALALYEEDPELAARVIHRAIASIQRAMAEYAPDGAYPEGPGYWEYGTTFNVLLIDALEQNADSDFGLFALPGFAQTPDYYRHMVAPSGHYFNYSDCGLGAGPSPAMFWFARRLDDLSLLWMEKSLLANFLDDAGNSARSGGRFFPMILAWAPSLQNIPPPNHTHYQADGPTPIAVHRTSWQDPRAVYLAVKAGTPSANHAHMDVGSFVLEADGVRWSLDLGAQNYHSLESRGLNIWNRSQDSDRWRVFRYTNKAHSTLVMDDQPQRVRGFAPIQNHTADNRSGFTIINMNEVYDPPLASARRGFRFLPSGRVLVQDEMHASSDGNRVQWLMLTRAEVSPQEDGKAVLTQEGQTLHLQVLDPPKVSIHVDSAQPPAEHDAPNPGVQRVIIESSLPPDSHNRLAVLLTPGSRQTATPETIRLSPLDSWH